MVIFNDLTSDYLRLYDFMLDPNTDKSMLDGAIEAVRADFAEKMEGFAKVCEQTDSDIEGIKNVIDRLTNRKKAMESNRDYLKKQMEDAMRVTGNSKLKTDLYTFSIQKNPPSLKIRDDVDMDLVPAEYIVFSAPQINKAKVKDAIKAGESFDWAELVQTDGLRIK